MHYDVTIVVVTYNPSIEKLILTLESILSQKEVNLQIVIADDGSSLFPIEEIRTYFLEKKFSDYKIVENTINQGTVKNLISGVIESDSDLIKGISPGDMIADSDVLSMWISGLNNSKKEWSFSQAFYYEEKDGNVVPVKHLCEPNNTACYSRSNVKACKYGALLFDDNILGASVLAKKDFLLKYLYLINDKVKYAEDNTYRLMIRDGIIPLFFRENAILYEYGSGISTRANSIWLEKIMNDAEATNRIILSLPAETLADRIINFFYTHPLLKRILKKIHRCLRIPNYSPLDFEYQMLNMEE